MGIIGGVLPMLFLLAFIGGYAWAGKFCKGAVERFFMGIVLGIGILLMVAAIAFAGCVVVISSGGFGR